MPDTPKTPNRASLKKRVVSTGIWHLFGSIGQTGFRLGSNLIMTRLLLPEAFGMLALATTLLTAMNLFTDIGVNRSIARELDGADDHFLRVAWVIKILRSLLVSAFTLLLALGLWLFGAGMLPSDSGYAQPEMPGLIALVALAPILQNLASTNRELAARNLGIGRIIIIDLSAQALGIITMVIFANISPTVWALMLGMLSRHAYFAVFTHVFLPGPRMAFVWDQDIANRLWDFGKWIIGSSALTFLGRFADNLILAALMNTASFGLYSIAKIWLSAGRRMVVRLTNGVGYLALAEVERERPQDVPKLYRKIQIAVDVVCISGFLGTVFLGPLIVQVLYTDTYWQAGQYLQLMAGGFLMQRMDNHVQLLLARGNSRAAMFVSGLQALGVCILVPLFYTLWDINGAILGIVLAPALSSVYVLFLMKPILGAKQTALDTAIYLASLAAIFVVFSTLA